MAQRAALLVIDMRDFWDPRGYAAPVGMAVERLQAPIPPIRRLLAAARAAEIAVASEGGILGAFASTDEIVASWRQGSP